MIGRIALVTLALAAGCNNSKSSSDKPAAAPATTMSTTASGATTPSDAAPAPDAAPAANAGPTWAVYTSKEGGFTMKLPGKAEERVQGGVRMVGAEFGVTAQDDRTAMCGATFVEMPAQGAAPEPKVVLEGALARHKQSGKVIEDKELTLDKHPGRSLIVETESHRKWMRVFLVDKKLFILTCGGPFDRAATDGPIALESLGSFALTK